MEQYAINVAKWLQQRVQEAEANDPMLRPMKDRINELTDELKTATSEEIPKLLELQKQAIKKLIDHVSNKQS